MKKNVVPGFIEKKKQISILEFNSTVRVSSLLQKYSYLDIFSSS